MKPTDKAAESLFWDRYIEALKVDGVPESAWRWYVVRIERYIAAHPDHTLRSHGANDVTQYLTEAGRKWFRDTHRISSETQTFSVCRRERNSPSRHFSPLEDFS